MTKKLDSESLGIILLNAFMEEFFPKEETSAPDMFQIIHYNGLARSNINKQVKWYHFKSIFWELLMYVLDRIPLWICHLIGIRFEVDQRLRSYVNLFTNKMAKH